MFVTSTRRNLSRCAQRWHVVLVLACAMFVMSGCASRTEDERPETLDGDDGESTVGARDDESDGDDKTDDDDNTDDDNPDADDKRDAAVSPGKVDARAPSKTDAAAPTKVDAATAPTKADAAVAPGKADASSDVAPPPVASGAGGCGGLTLPPVTDYGAKGPFDTQVVNNTGPDGQYTMYRPTTLGKDGFKHPPTTWGNGITTTPSLYPGLLGGIASHGFVIIASNSSNVTASLMTAGLDWLLAQNEAAGDFKDKLSVDCAVSIGYSLGGGAAVDTGKHKKVVTTVSFHGLQGTAELLHGPLLLFTGTGDDFVTASGFVTPTFNRSKVQTFYGTLTGATHLKPVGDAGEERAPAIAWLRLWVYGDQNARKYFYGDDCLLCKSPWVMPQRKNWP